MRPLAVLALARSPGRTALRGCWRCAVVRRALGPALVAVAIVGAGPIDLATLVTPSAGPLVWLALLFAA